MPDKEMRDKESVGVEFELESLIRFLSRNLFAIVLFGILGLGFGLWLAFTTNTYSAGGRFHNYEARVNLIEELQLPEGNTRVQSQLGVKFDQDLISIVKPKVLGELTNLLPPGNNVAVSGTFVENTMPFLIQISAASPIDDAVLQQSLREAVARALQTLNEKQGAAEEKAKAYLLSLQTQLFRIYQKQGDVLQALKVKIPDLMTRNGDKDTYLELRQLAAALNVSPISDQEKTRIQSEFYDLEFQAVKISNDYKTFQKSVAYYQIVEHSRTRYEVSRVETINTSGKEVNRRIVICLSALCGGLALGVLFSIVRQKLHALAFWVKQYKSRTE